MTHLLTIHGYFCTAKEYTFLDRLLLDKEVYKESVKRFDPANLEITTLQKKYGSFMQHLDVIGIVDTAEGSLIPFFIDKKKLKKLQEVMKLARPSAIMDL